jgi:hypothetical protein
LLLKMKEAEDLDFNEIKALREISQAENLSPEELIARFIREGMYANVTNMDNHAESRAKDESTRIHQKKSSCQETLP